VAGFFKRNEAKNKNSCDKLYNVILSLDKYKINQEGSRYSYQKN
jgi:hypothetical protein